MSGQKRNPTTDATTYQTAAEFFAVGCGPARADQWENPPAKTVIWYDQRTPVYACEDHADPLDAIHWEGSRFDVDEHETIRAAVHERLFSEKPPECAVCSDSLPTPLSEVLGL